MTLELAQFAAHDSSELLSQLQQQAEDGELRGLLVVACYSRDGLAFGMTDAAYEDPTIAITGAFALLQLCSRTVTDHITPQTAS